MNDQQSDPPPRPAAPGDDDFARTAGRMLRDSADELDAATAARLNHARQAALDHAEDRRRQSAWLTPALSTAAIGALAVALWLNQGAAPDGTVATAPAVESEADLDLLEDLEFYAWLDLVSADGEAPLAQEPAG